MQVNFMGNPDSGDEYIEWRLKGLTTDQFARGIEMMGDEKRDRVKELYLGQNGLESVPHTLGLFRNVRDLDFGSNLLRTVKSFCLGLLQINFHCLPLWIGTTAPSLMTLVFLLISWRVCGVKLSISYLFTLPRSFQQWLDLARYNSTGLLT